MTQYRYDSSTVAALRDFLKLESASGILLVIAGVLAMVAANTPLAEYYQALLQTPIKLQVGAFKLDKTLLIWVDDLLMAIFFLLVGLEIKREVVAGELSERSKVALPAVAALGGMIVPAAIYAALNWHDPIGIRGWAIPSATDIAFALGLLSLFGNRVPVGLKVFLLTLAVLDDLGAISFNKGCYTGQEVVARIHFRGHVNRLLRLLASESPLAVGSRVIDAAGTDVGEVRTSVVPATRGPLAIAMVRREVEPGSDVTVRSATSDVRARVSPLVPGGNMTT